VRDRWSLGSPMSFVDDTVYLLVAGTRYGLKLTEEDALTWLRTAQPSDRAYEVRYLDQRSLAETAEGRLQRVERCMLALTAEWMQLTGRAEPPMPKSERERMRDVTATMSDVIAAMRPIVDAALRWLRGSYDGVDPRERALMAALGANSDRLATAMAAWRLLPADNDDEDEDEDEKVEESPT
jgi:hypothetical protein